MTSWWLQDAMSGELDAPPLEDEVQADVCIVGGGYTGLWTALRVKELSPATEVTIVERGVCGSGASGRNGGFALTFWHHFVGLRALCGEQEALRLGDASETAVEQIGAVCADHGIDADYRHDGWLWAATNDAQRGAWNSTVEALGKAGRRPFRTLEGDEAARRTGSRRHLEGVFEPTAATVQPARLARGLRRLAIERGVRVYERSPMVELERGRTLSVRTPHGRVRAQRVVIAMNAWSARLRELRNAFVVVASDLVITDPIPQTLAGLGWRDGMSISDSRLMVHYYRTTSDGRVAFGKGGCALGFDGRADLRGSGRRAAQVASRLRELYPALAATPLAGAWTGPIDRPVDGLPFFTTLGRPDLICGAGFAGNGVGPTVVAGRVLASMALGRDDEWSGCGLVRRPPRGLPPEPLRWIGGHVVKAAVARKERAQDAGRRPGRVASAVAGLAPAGLVPVD